MFNIRINDMISPEPSLAKYLPKKYGSLADDLSSEIEKTRKNAVLILGDLIHSGYIEKNIRITDYPCVSSSWYSFSPYSPSAAALKAFALGYDKIILRDKNTCGAYEEFSNTCNQFGISPICSTILDLSLEGTAFENKVFDGYPECGVVSIDFIPVNKDADLAQAESDVFRVIRKAKSVRCAVETWNLRSILDTNLISADFWNEAIDYSLYEKSGDVSEEHIFASLASKIHEIYSPGTNSVVFMHEKLGMEFSEEEEKLLKNLKTPYYILNLARILKKHYLSEIYVSGYKDPELKSDILPLKMITDKMKDCGFYPVYMGSENEEKFKSFLLENGIESFKSLYHKFSPIDDILYK